MVSTFSHTTLVSQKLYCGTAVGGQTNPLDSLQRQYRLVECHQDQEDAHAGHLTFALCVGKMENTTFRYYS